MEVGTFLHALTGFFLIQVTVLLEEVQRLVEHSKRTDKDTGKVRVTDSQGRVEVIQGRVINEDWRR